MAHDFAIIRKLSAVDSKLQKCVRTIMLDRAFYFTYNLSKFVYVRLQKNKGSLTRSDSLWMAAARLLLVEIDDLIAPSPLITTFSSSSHKPSLFNFFFLPNMHVQAHIGK